MTDGTIVKGIGGFYYVKTNDGVAECRARGKLRKCGITPMVGDRVGITVVNSMPYEGAVETVYDRKNFLVRPPVANIDCVAVVVAAASPSPDMCLTDKLLVCAEKAGIKAVVVLNKTDLDEGAEIQSAYESAGYTVVRVCAATGEGVDRLRELLKGKITAFAGNSGVGKSSLLNYFGFDLQTGDVSKIERGRHTTRHVELMPLDTDGYVMDTPGFSLLELSDVKAYELSELFPEFAQFNGKCRFHDCRHFGVSTKDCAVARAVDEDLISRSRYESYCAIYDVLKEINDYD